MFLYQLYERIIWKPWQDRNIFDIIHTRYDFLERWNYCKRLLLEELQVKGSNDLCTSSWSSVIILFWFCFVGWAILGLGSVNVPKAKTCWSNEKQIFQSKTFHRFQSGLIRLELVPYGIMTGKNSRMKSFPDKLTELKEKGWRYNPPITHCSAS